MADTGSRRSPAAATLADHAQLPPAAAADTTATEIRAASDSTTQEGHPQQGTRGGSGCKQLISRCRRIWQSCGRWTREERACGECCRLLHCQQNAQKIISCAVITIQHVSSGSTLAHPSVSQQWAPWVKITARDLFRRHVIYNSLESASIPRSSSSSIIAKLHAPIYPTQHTAAHTLPAQVMKP